MDPSVLRDDMVDSLEHEAKAVLSTDRVSLAMRAVPRHEFIDGEPSDAYHDRDLDHRGSRILAPSKVARLMEALGPTPEDRVLVVGAGVGYTAAVLAEICGARNVHAIDLSRDLVLDARRNLRRAGYDAVLVDCEDAADGLPAYAPYDRILVEAGAVAVPTALRRQLAADGRIVLPLGRPPQRLVGVDTPDSVHEWDALDPDARTASNVPVESYGRVEFDPLLVSGEQPGTVERNRTAREEAERVARAADSHTGWEQDWIDWESG